MLDVSGLEYMECSLAYYEIGLGTLPLVTLPILQLCLMPDDFVLLSGLVLSFCLGYAVTVSAGLASYPIDTIRRRMMMTSGEAVKYKGSIDCFLQVSRNEGVMSLMKGAGANILRGVAGAGVLAGFDKFKALYIAWRLS
jgi:hypothetical protein